MSYDFLLEPVNEDQPCGPDLDESFDDAYINYFTVAEMQFPNSYFDQNNNTPFSKSNINLKDTKNSIEELLLRSRDIRLLILSARLNILGGGIREFCTDIISISKLLEGRWEDVHPQLKIDPKDRGNQLSYLEDKTTVILPLQFAELVRTKKAGVISYRDFALATGKINKTASENNTNKTLTDLEIISALKSDDCSEEVENIHALLVNTYQATNVIKETFIEHNGYENLPSLDKLAETLFEMLSMFTLARDDLATKQSFIINDENDKVEGNQEDAQLEENGVFYDTISITEIPESPDGIKCHSTAKAALKASEIYYATYEPSSPALVLIHQARNLIGVSLIEAIDILMPEAAERASILINQKPNFQISATQLRAVSNNSKQSVNSNDGDKMKKFVASSRAQAMALIIGVKDYYHAAEPSSPVPHLLIKAHSYLDRNFESIINDIIKPDLISE